MRRRQPERVRGIRQLREFRCGAYQMSSDLISIGRAKECKLGWGFFEEALGVGLSGWCYWPICCWYYSGISSLAVLLPLCCWKPLEKRRASAVDAGRRIVRNALSLCTRSWSFTLVCHPITPLNLKDRNFREIAAFNRANSSAVFLDSLRRRKKHYSLNLPTVGTLIPHSQAIA